LPAHACSESWSADPFHGNNGGPVPFLHPKQNISLDALKCLLSPSGCNAVAALRVSARPGGSHSVR